MPLTPVNSNSAATLLTVNDLHVRFSQTGTISSEPVKGVSFSLQKGEMLALVGESGSGKSLTAQSIMRLLPDHTQYQGQIVFDGEDLLQVPIKRLQQLRGAKIGMIFQEPMTSLNPLHTIEQQISENILQHQSLSKTQAKERTLELLHECFTLNSLTNTILCPSDALRFPICNETNQFTDSNHYFMDLVRE